MKAVLIPVKDLSQAKQRLAASLSAAERTALARAMLEDVFSAVAAAHGFDQVYVISSDAPVLAKARGLGWETIPETRQVSESDSVDLASRWCEERGVTSLLRLPTDVPLVQPEDIEAVFEQSEARAEAVLVPSRDGTGTNALLRTPPALFPSHFGPGSLARHLAEAERCGARARVLRNSRLELDVDELDDLRALAANGLRPTATAAWLADHDYVLGGLARK